MLRSHADVEEAAVVGVPSERWGETPVAFVVPKRQDPQLPKTLLDWTNSQLGKTQRLAAIELVETLPRSAIGKVLKRELRERYRNKGSESVVLCWIESFVKIQRNQQTWLRSAFA